MISNRTRLLRLVHLLLGDALVLGAGLPLVDLLLGCPHLPVTIALSILLFVLAVCLLLLEPLLALLTCILHRIVILVVRLVDALAILGRLRRQAELLVELAPQLLELCQALAQIVVLEVAARLRILVLAIWIFVEVDAFEIVKIKVVDVGVGVLSEAALVRGLRQRRQRRRLLDQLVASGLQDALRYAMLINAVAKPTFSWHPVFLFIQIGGGEAPLFGELSQLGPVRLGHKVRWCAV